MFRGSRSATTLLLAPAIPVATWDPKHHNHKFVDSYAKAVADRRQWPAKKWAVGIEPRVKSDWNQFSLRNLAYQYNGRLRASSNFPEMIPIYTEMKIRGVKMDTDTMTVMLSRGARFTPITANDLFLLFDEMLSLGAKPDIAVIEVLHTVLDHAPTETTGTWFESKRQKLIAHYDQLCAEEVLRLGEKGYGMLLASQVARYRKNVAALDGRLSTLTWKQYLSVIPTVEQLFEELANFLHEYVPKDLANDFPRTEMRFTGTTTIPHLYRHSVLTRPTNRPAGAEEGLLFSERMSYRSQFADDLAINEVMLSALHRFIDTPLETRLPRSDETALLLLFEKFVKSTGVLITADLAAQMMEVCKFATTFSNEAAAQRIYQMAFHGSAVPNSPFRLSWKLAEYGVDGRVLGRFLAARNPWGSVMFDISNKGTFGNFSSALDVNSDESTSASDEATKETSDGTDNKAEGTTTRTPSAKESSNSVLFTAAAVRERWESVQRAVNNSSVLDLTTFVAAKQPIDVDAIMEVYTGQACFLRNMFLEERYPPTEEHLRAAGQLNTDPDAYNKSSRRVSVASRSMTIEACKEIFEALHGLKRAMDMQITEARSTVSETTLNPTAAPVELVPELECWESMLLVSKHMLDFLLSRRDQSGHAGRQVSDELFKRVASFRHELLEESKDKYGGRFKILWLQEM